ncbi:MAG: hypothetical protein CMJ18_02170 [Phycisphaeraceae bacterium]|nr:hypothetical protein [Phycisphaeraceae bacterium]
MAKKRTIWDEVRIWATVAFVTLLIWLYAEAKTLQSDDLAIKVRFVSKNPELYRVQGEVIVQMRYFCTSGQIAEVRNLPQPFEITITQNGTDEPQRTVALREQLARFKPLSTRGVIIEQVRPESATIQYFRLEKRTLDVRPQYNAELLTDEPKIETLRASVRLPAEVFEDVADPALRIVLDDELITDRDVGVPYREQLPIRLTPELDARVPELFEPEIDPETTFVSFTIKNRNVGYETRRAVKATLPIDAVGRFTLELDQKYQEIKLEGKEDVIAKIDEEPDLVRVYLDLTEEELEPGEHTIQPRVEVPADVVITDPLKLITLTVRARAAAPEDARPEPDLPDLPDLPAE